MIIPFGKHNGRDIKDVPAKYLLWLGDQDWIWKFGDIKKWILDNNDDLLEQAEEEKYEDDNSGQKRFKFKK